MRGIYGFKNKETNKWYIGQSINIESRFYQHIIDSIKNDKELVEFHKELKKYPFEDNYWEFRIFENNNSFTNEELDLYEARYIELYNSKENGYNATKGNHAERINKILKTSMKLVSPKVCKTVWNKYKFNTLSDCIILIIGHFDFCQSFILNNNKVYIISDNISYNENGAKITRTCGKEEIIMEIEKLKNNYFDLIISNPPYEIGNEITKAVIDNVNFREFVNIMPLSKYKKSNLYNYIIPSSIIYSTSTVNFDGAFTSPIICKLNKTRISEYNYNEFEIRDYYDNRLRKFWDQQLKRIPTFNQYMSFKLEDLYMYPSKTTFSCGMYTPNILLKNGPKTLKNSDGTFKTEDRHYIWNFIKPEGTLNKYFKNYTGQTLTVFSTERERDNFTKWFHSAELNGKDRLSGLSSILLWCMHKSTACPFNYAIPYVDWNKEWTDEEILKDYGFTDKEIKEVLSIPNEYLNIKG